MNKLFDYKEDTNLLNWLNLEKDHQIITITKLYKYIRPQQTKNLFSKQTSHL